MDREQIAELWPLCGTESARWRGEQRGSLENLHGGNVPLDFARHVIRHEWAHTLDDLVERRLMLLYQPSLTIVCLRQLAGLLVEAGRLSSGDADRAVLATVARLKDLYGRQIQSDVR
jgi:hypothetical protein